MKAADEQAIPGRGEDGQRPLAVNLAEGLALSKFLATFTGSARDS